RSGGVVGEPAVGTGAPGRQGAGDGRLTLPGPGTGEHRLGGRPGSGYGYTERTGAGRSVDCLVQRSAGLGPLSGHQRRGIGRLASSQNRGATAVRAGRGAGSGAAASGCTQAERGGSRQRHPGYGQGPQAESAEGNGMKNVVLPMLATRAVPFDSDQYL